MTRVSGVQSEMELAFAGLHQLCVPALDLLGNLPAPQCEALRTVFGISAGPPPDMFLIGLAVLSLLSEAAERQPLVCLVDDQQWLDRCSAQILAFVARRLGAESVGLIFATRDVGQVLAGVPEFPIDGLRDTDARLLLDAVLAGPIDAQVRDQLVAEAHGNPLALLELPRGSTPAQLAGGFGLPGAGDIEESFVRRVTAMPDETRRLLASPRPTRPATTSWYDEQPRDSGSVRRRRPRRPTPDWRSSRPGSGSGTRSCGQRRTARRRPWSGVRSHQALAEVIDAEVDPDRRAWHRAQAAAGPDEEIAAELERSAARAQARSGFAATAAFLQRSAALTLDPAKRAGRALAAAQAEMQAGAFDSAADLLAHGRGRAAHRVAARPGRADPRATRVRHQPWQRRAAADAQGGQAAGDHRRCAVAGDVPGCALGRIFAGGLATPGGDVIDVARAAARAPRPALERPSDLLLDGTALYFRDGYAQGAQPLHRALAGFGTGLSVEDELQLLWMATTTSLRLWDADRWSSCPDGTCSSPERPES